MKTNLWTVIGGIVCVSTPIGIRVAKAGYNDYVKHSQYEREMVLSNSETEDAHARSFFGVQSTHGKIYTKNMKAEKISPHMIEYKGYSVPVKASIDEKTHYWVRMSSDDRESIEAFIRETIQLNHDLPQITFTFYNRKLKNAKKIGFKPSWIYSYDEDIDEKDKAWLVKLAERLEDKDRLVMVDRDDLSYYHCGERWEDSGKRTIVVWNRNALLAFNSKRSKISTKSMKIEAQNRSTVYK